jgi:hypothetical protein
MNRPPPITVRDYLLTRRGLAFVPPSGASPPENLVRAVELELAGVGYAASARLQAALACCAPAELAEFRRRTVDALQAHVGGGRRHEPLFRRFPDGVPDDTADLWWRKVLCHFLQAEGQPCLFCRRVGTTHVLNPCKHVVCDRCFDGANYGACPVCERHVDRASPFFLPAPKRGEGRERRVFKLLDLGSSLEDEARQLFRSLAERRQALSPDDREALVACVREFGAGVLPWLPPAIPVRENVATVFGTLLQGLDPGAVLPHAQRFLKTATDVLRLVAVLSGTDGSLQKEVVFKRVVSLEGPHPFWARVAEALRAKKPGPSLRQTVIPVRVNRFKVARLSRPLRRALLALLEGMDAERLTEDLLRHRSFWVGIGEFLHPAEYASKFPKVAKAFLSVRRNAPDGTPEPPFRGWASRLERAVREGDSAGMVAVLSERPGELARRFDHALRVAGGNSAAVERAAAAFEARVKAFANPVLLTLRSHLPARVSRAPVRVYWPKGRVAKGVSAPDARAPLSPEAVARALRPVERELLRRFGSKPAFGDCVIDEGLRAVVAPFNERTASPSAVSLPRGSRVPVPAGKRLRLFLHWCEPRDRRGETDLDLSVAFYDAAWKYLGVCSYYELKCVRGSPRACASP